MFSTKKFFSHGAPDTPENSEPGTLWAWGTGSFSTENSDGTFYSNGLFGDDSQGTWGVNREYRKPVQIGGKYASRFGDHKWLSVSSVGLRSPSVLAIREDKTLWAWGENYEGRFADGTNTNRVNPVQIGGVGSKWKEVSTSYYHTLAIRDDGTLWSWGANVNGVLGDGGIALRRWNPYKIGNDTWISVCACWNNSYAIKSDGTLWGWGENLGGNVGIGTTGLDINTPVQIGSESNWQTLSPSNSSFALKNDGTLWCWGMNSAYTEGSLPCCSSNKIGDGNGCKQNGKDCFVEPICTAQEYADALNCWCPECRYVVDRPGTQYQVVAYDKRPVKVPSSWSSSFNRGYGIKIDGTLYSFSDAPFPASWPNIPPETQWSKVSTSETGQFGGTIDLSIHHGAIRQDGTLWMWGDNDKWQCGGDVKTYDQGIKQVGSATWSKVFCFAGFTMAIR